MKTYAKLHDETVSAAMAMTDKVNNAVSGVATSDVLMYVGMLSITAGLYAVAAAIEGNKSAN